MKSTPHILSALILSTGMLVSATALAAGDMDDLTMQVIDAQDTTPQSVTREIELPATANEHAVERVEARNKRVEENTTSAQDKKDDHEHAASDHDVKEDAQEHSREAMEESKNEAKSEAEQDAKESAHEAVEQSTEMKHVDD